MRSPRLAGRCLFLLATTLVAASSGCALLYQVANGDGHMVEPKFTGLAGKRVAVVCMPSSAAYDSEDTSVLLAQSIERLLRERVKEIETVRHDEVADWMDHNDWDDVDYGLEIGRGVKADMVLAVNLDEYNIHEGTTLFKGRAAYSAVVYDVAANKEVFRLNELDYEFPKSHAQHVSTISEQAFKRQFISILANHIAKNFYKYKFVEDFAGDGAAYAH